MSPEVNKTYKLRFNKPLERALMRVKRNNFDCEDVDIQPNDTITYLGRDEAVFSKGGLVWQVGGFFILNGNPKKKFVMFNDYFNQFELRFVENY